jgi:hypothetical protein
MTLSPRPEAAKPWIATAKIERCPSHTAEATQNERISWETQRCIWLSASGCEKTLFLKAHKFQETSAMDDMRRREENKKRFAALGRGKSCMFAMKPPL